MVSRTSLHTNIIGGPHRTGVPTESGLNGEVAAAVDINTVANEVYIYNFPKTKLLNRNIQSLTIGEIKHLKVNTILMSPPCQPFTRNGKNLDNNDPRTNSFIYIINILNQLDNIEYILMENVKGFECSAVRNIFVKKLEECEFNYQEFLLCPTSIGVPNSRLRYYCIAKRNNLMWGFKRKEGIMEKLPKEYGEPNHLQDIIEINVDDRFLIPDKLLKRANILDICHKESKRSCCFTKAYSHYIEGTGSVFTNMSIREVEKFYTQANLYKVGTAEFVDSLKQLRLRFFTPSEVLKLMNFPHCYKFPSNLTIKQSYRLLGNSINCKVVSELLKLLFE